MQKEIEAKHNIKIHISPETKNNKQTITLRGGKNETQQGIKDITNIIKTRKEREPKQITCRFYQQGYCREGTACRYNHPNQPFTEQRQDKHRSRSPNQQTNDQSRPSKRHHPDTEADQTKETEAPADITMTHTDHPEDNTQKQHHTDTDQLPQTENTEEKNTETDTAEQKKRTTTTTNAEKTTTTKTTADRTTPAALTNQHQNPY